MMLLLHSAVAAVADITADGATLQGTRRKLKLKKNILKLLQQQRLTTLKLKLKLPQGAR
jgi:hypothetical protein